MTRVGTIPDFEANKELSEHPWPTFITAGDISRDGKMIMLRGHQGLFQHLILTIYIYIYKNQLPLNIIFKHNFHFISICFQMQEYGLEIQHWGSRLKMY